MRGFNDMCFLEKTNVLTGFTHTSLAGAPSTSFLNPTWATASDIDFAGNKPSNIVRVGTGDSSTGKQVALSGDYGINWYVTLYSEVVE